jgi:hypothetical protein
MQAEFRFSHVELLAAVSASRILNKNFIQKTPKTKKMKKAFIALLIVSSIISCKKTDSGSNNCTTSSATLAGTYKKTAALYKASPSAAAVDMLSTAPACEKDDTYSLNTDGSYAQTDAGVSCGLPPAPGSEAWTLQSSNTQITLGAETYSIVSFDCKNLVVSSSDVSTPGDNLVITYQKQ